MNSKTKNDVGQVNAVCVLFARTDSVYKSLPYLDVYDIERDARNYSGSLPVVAHPPCRAWGRLRQFAKPRPDERELAHFAVSTIRRVGGVLEHPASSILWPVAGLPAPGQRDAVGGFTLPILQSWFGHPCPKSTWLYIVGVDPREIPAFPFSLGRPAGRVDLQTKADREKTPFDLANWLVHLAASCEVSG